MQEVLKEQAELLNPPSRCRSEITQRKTLRSAVARATLSQKIKISSTSDAENL